MVSVILRWGGVRGSPGALWQALLSLHPYLIPQIIGNKNLCIFLKSFSLDCLFYITLLECISINLGTANVHKLINSEGSFEIYIKLCYTVSKINHPCVSPVSDSCHTLKYFNLPHFVEREFPFCSQQKSRFSLIYDFGVFN